MGGASSHPQFGGEHDPVSLQMEGFLQKRSEHLLAWNPRYAVLKNQELRYWDSEELYRRGTAPRGRIALAQCAIGKVEGDPTLFDCFRIETPLAVDGKRAEAQRGQQMSYWQAPTLPELDAWVKTLQIASREPWEADSARDTCCCCDAPFELFTRRHHCRRCGRLTCATCSPNKQEMPLFNYFEAVRVCKECYGERGPLLPPEERQRTASAKAEMTARDKSIARQKAIQSQKAGSAATAEDRKRKLREQFNVT